MRYSLLFLCFAAFFSWGCDASPPDAGQVVLVAGEGIDFSTGAVVAQANFKNADLYTSRNGDRGPKISPGGESVVDARPTTWFRSTGGVHVVYGALDEVPEAPLPEGSGEVLLNAVVGYGFVTLSADGSYVKGRIDAASEMELTLSWQRL